jgi:peptide/nickel transport system permease protein
MTRANGNLVFGAAIIGGIILMALISLIWTPYDPIAMQAASGLSAPSMIHLMGTDAYGRDVLSMVMAGARAAVIIPTAACLIGLIFGTAMGLTSALVGGRIEEAIIGIGDMVFAFPALLTAVLLAAAFGPGMIGAIIAIGLFSVPVFARITRAAALRELARDYTQAARSLGRSPWAMALVVILPNIADILIVQSALQLSLNVAADAGLAYIGLGVQPPHPGWGRLLADAQTLFSTAPWLALCPGLAIVVTIFGLTRLADGLRTWLDD